MTSMRPRTLGSLIASTLMVAAMVIPSASPATANTTHGSIGGTITENGAPVGGVSIYVHSDDGGFSRSANTRENGSYEILNVPAARSPYLLTIYADGRPDQYAYGKAEPDTAARIPVTAGERTVVDDALLPVGFLAGRLTDSAGNGISAWVSAVSDESPGNSTYTDSDGSYSLAVFPGSYRVSFHYGNIYQYAYRTTNYQEATRFTVAAGQTVAVNDVTMAAGSIAGRVTNADGSPAADLEVQASGETGEEYVYTDEFGNYRIDQLLPGAYKLSFRLPSNSTQWAPQSRSRDSAQEFTVEENGVTTVDEQLLPTGVIAGEFVDANGVGISRVQVTAHDEYENSLYTSTDANGRYRIAGALTGSYKVQFYKWPDVEQYAYGKVSSETADASTVLANETSTVNDTQLPTGSVRFTATDSVTGAAINSFFAYVGDRGGNARDGALVVSGIPIGTYPVSAGGDDYAWAENLPPVTVTAGTQTEVALALRPHGKIATTVVDRASGAPVAGMCVFAVLPTRFTFPDGCQNRSDSTGAVSIRVSDPGNYHLFVLPERTSPYGAQWVGPDGGTGSQLTASRLAVSAGVTTAAPTIKLDGRGTITGTVTSVTGEPIERGTVGILGPDLGAGVDRRYSSVAADGSYTLDWLGPYRWPLLFKAKDHPYQWSGGVGNRLLARPVQVQVGAASTLNHRLKQGAEVTVTIPGQSGSERVVIYNAITGDPMGVNDGSTSEGVNLQIIGPQLVKVGCYCGSGAIWYGGTDFASARPVLVPSTGGKQVTFPTS